MKTAEENSSRDGFRMSFPCFKSFAGDLPAAAKKANGRRGLVNLGLPGLLQRLLANAGSFA